MHIARLVWLALVLCSIPFQEYQHAGLMVANILAEPLIELASTIKRLIKPRGKFALSGILSEQTESVAMTYRTFAELDSPLQMDDWILITGQRH